MCKSTLESDLTPYDLFFKMKKDFENFEIVTTWFLTLLIGGHIIYYGLYGLVNDLYRYIAILVFSAIILCCLYISFRQSNKDKKSDTK